MGDMTLKGLDEAVLMAIAQKASLLGLSSEEYARDVLERDAYRASHQRGEVARRILAKQRLNTGPDAVEILRELREGT
jgi:hypothetical protein